MIDEQNYNGVDGVGLKVKMMLDYLREIYVYHQRYISLFDIVISLMIQENRWNTSLRFYVDNIFNRYKIREKISEYLKKSFHRYSLDVLKS